MSVDRLQQDGVDRHINLLIWAEEHFSLVLALVAVVAFWLYTRYQAGKAQISQPIQQDLSGLQTDANGNPIVYVPTSTEFYTDNSIIADQGATIGPVNSPVATTTINEPTTTTTITPPPVVPVPVIPPTQQPPVRMPPVAPAPPVHAGGLVWDQTTTVLGGQNLTRIASAVTTRVRTQGAPSSVTITWQDIYAHNQSVIDSTARQHGYQTALYNEIFPGERLVVPRWVKG